MNYQQYIQSTEWIVRRRLFLLNHKKVCAICGFYDQLEVHHLNYDNLGNEKDEDLIILCRRCHNDTHYSSNTIEPATKQLLRELEITEEKYQKYIQTIDINQARNEERRKLGI